MKMSVRVEEANPSLSALYIMIKLGVQSIIVERLLFLKATSQAAIFRACMYAIKDTDDVLPEKGGSCCSS